MSDQTAEVARKAEDYYDSSDADRFYAAIWGGEDIHVGIYEHPDGDIRAASELTVERMMRLVPELGAGKKVLDLGAGYGGAARKLASTTGCSVTCLNISEVQNDRNRKLNREAGLDDRIRVVHGNFESIPEAESSYDVVWSQDAFLHSGNREAVLREAHRVLKPGGLLIFTDPMQADDCPKGVLQPILDRIHLNSLGSVAFYRKTLDKLGFDETGVDLLTDQLRTHYSRVKQTLQEHYPKLGGSISREYFDNMIRGLDHWIDGADRGYLAWGILRFHKR